MDRHGYLRAYQVRDGDSDEGAEEGIQVSPPDVGKIDCERLQKEVNNELVRRLIFTWEDVIKHQNAVSRIAASVVKRQLIEMFRSAHYFDTAPNQTEKTEVASD
jgi:hypothetical protein